MPLPFLIEKHTLPEKCIDISPCDSFKASLYVCTWGDGVRLATACVAELALCIHTNKRCIIHKMHQIQAACTSLQHTCRITKAAQSHGADKIHLPLWPSHERLQLIYLRPTHEAAAQRMVRLAYSPCKQRCNLVCATTQTDSSFLLTSTDAHQARPLRQVLLWQHVESLCKLQNRQTTVIIFATFYL